MARITDQTKNDSNKLSSGTSSGVKESSEMSSRKRNLTLDLQFYGSAKKVKFDSLKETAPVLSSPDIKKLKLKTPELENIILQNGLTTSTPTPSSLLFPKVVTEAQEEYARGFFCALNELHGSDSSQGGTGGMDSSSNSNSNSDNSLHFTELLSQPALVIKEEQVVPSMSDSPLVSPIDMKVQEIMKLEKKRERNRVAASKCRRRKLERISRLEDKVKMLKNENNELSGIVMKLKDQVCLLKGQVMEHVQSGCPIKGHW